MAIERNRFGFDGEITFECDECGEEIHTDEADFHAALKVMKKEGWTNVQEKGDWNHYCPGCQEEEDDPEDDFDVLD